MNERRDTRIVARGPDERRCAVLGCPCEWDLVRVATGGSRIGYCLEHYQQALRYFSPVRRSAEAAA